MRYLQPPDSIQMKCNLTEFLKYLYIINYFLKYDSWCALVCKCRWKSRARGSLYNRVYLSHKYGMAFGNPQIPTCPLRVLPNCCLRARLGRPRTDPLHWLEMWSWCLLTVGDLQHHPHLLLPLDITTTVHVISALF